MVRYAARTVPHQNWYGTQREPYRTKTGAVRIAVWFAVLNNKRITVTINGSVRFALLTVRLKNGTVTVALAVLNGTVKKTENSTVRTRCGTVRTR